MKIKIKAPHSEYETVIDPGVSEVDITEAFIGVRLIHEGNALCVSMRDDGFEINLNGTWYHTHHGKIVMMNVSIPETPKCDGCGATENVLRYENSGAFLYVGDYMFLCNACLGVLNSVAQTRRNNA